MKSRRRFIKEMAAVGAAVGFSPILLHGTQIDNIRVSPESKPFLQACEKGEMAIVKSLLLKNKGLLAAKDALGRSGFALAMLAGHKDVGAFLKQSGYETDLHEAALDQDWERYDQLIGEENSSTESMINKYHPMGGSVMWAAAAGGAGADMWRIYAKCGNPNAYSLSKAAPIQKALRYHDLAIAELTTAAILSNNTDPNPETNEDLPPLHIAAERGSYVMVEMLIRLGADIERKDKNGKLAIQLAEAAGKEEIVTLINENHKIPRTCRTSRRAFDVDGKPYERPSFEDVPLYLRRRLVGQAHGNLEYVQKTVKADPRMAHCVATTSEICVEACAHIGNKRIVEFLLKSGAPYSLPTAVMLNDFTTVKKLLEEDLNRIEERGAHDFGLLWYPVIGRCDLEMMQLLLDKGAKIEQQHFLGTTALHWACRRGPIEMVELLVQNGADVNRAGRKFSANGETSLQSTKDEKIADYLRSKGAG